ncbi:glycoside hydrolase family 2 protein [Undibacterium griseum]|uniref:beta-mannosidase n=1 Tax=Undibacterium griseum TaxID=2762295 RepID=A0ABR6YPI7_9BURK|nr:glycoside hydrolase family 2 protein [Undibacterium griseum]MBC3885703.1 glycoside hydrolase family 2 protein [Undibacterium griseum]
MTAVTTHADTGQSVQDGWTMFLLPPESGSCLPSAALAQAAVHWPASLPCTAASVLRDHNQPVTDLQYLDQNDIWFSRLLSIGSGQHFLHFEGLAGHTEIFWNDRLILRTANMFVAYCIDLDQQQMRGSGRLSLRFPALDSLLAQRRPRPRWKTRLVAQQQLRWLRTSLLGRMPGWSPPVPPVGPYRAVRLETCPPVRLAEHQLHSKLMGGEGIVNGHFHLSAEHAVTQVNLHVGDQVQELLLHSNGTETVAQGELVFEEPQCWWPHTHGQPHLYSAFLEVSTSHGKHFLPLHDVGFRSIHVQQNDGDFHLHLNGVPVFCRGACWTPADLFSLNADNATLRAMLQLVRDAGMNMLRLPGTMLYESDAFYQLCDEMGILIWQDFMFANMDYPVADLEFALNIQHEAESFLRRTQNRPCLAVLCGNSEVEQQAAMLGIAREWWRNPFFSDTLPQLCHTLRPDVLYWPSSPAGGVMPFHTDSGIAHYFGVGAYLRPVDDARRSHVRFTTECLGFSNMPDEQQIETVLPDGEKPGPHPRWKQRIPRDNGTSWDFEDVRDHYLSALYQTDASRLRATDSERYTELARTVSGDIMAQTLHEWRRYGSSCRGALIWFWRDLWAGAGWGVIDAAGRPKAAYYFLKRAMAPLAVFFSDEGLNGLTIHIVNDRPAVFTGWLELHLYRNGSQRTASQRIAIQLSGHSSQMLSADALLPHFSDTAYAYRFGPAGHDLASTHLYPADAGSPVSSDYHFCLGQQAFLETDPGLSAEFTPDDAHSGILTLETRRVALAVCISAAGATADHNFFHLAPGIRQSVRLTTTADTLPAAVTLKALNMPVRLRCPLTDFS